MNRTLPVVIFIISVVSLSAIGFLYPSRRMSVIVTVPLLFVSLYVVVTRRFQTHDKNWAYATIGTVVGFWLKG